MRLRCNAVGGRPLPAVTWWINDELVDDTYITKDRDTVVVNTLKDMRAERKYDGAKLECRASNNNVSSAQIRRLEIKINRKTLFIHDQIVISLLWELFPPFLFPFLAS